MFCIICIYKTKFMNLTSLTHFLEFKRKGKKMPFFAKKEIQTWVSQVKKQDMTTRLGLNSCYKTNMMD